MIHAGRWALSLFVSAFAIAACGVGEPEGGQTISLTIGAGHPSGGTITHTNELEVFVVPELERRFEEETEHTLSITEAYGGTIAGLDEILEATATGALDISNLQYVFEPSTLFLHNVAYYVPFGPPDVDVALRAFRRTIDEHEFLANVFEEEHNQKLLGLNAIGNYGLFTTFDWDNLDDLQGVPITAAGPNLPWLDPVGAVPIQGNLTEWYTGLQTGVYEGAVMFPEAGYGFRLHEVAPYYAITDFGAISVGGLHINLDTWNSLPEDAQRIIEEVGLAYEERQIEAVQTDADEALERMEEEGATIRELPADQLQQWVDSLPNIPGERAREADERGLPGSEVIGDYLRFVEEEGYELPREWPID